jgi:uncharacterized protein DUF1877
MSCLGVHFALTAEDVAALQSFSDEKERLSYLQEELEERYFSEGQSYIAESDKSWDAMHRALSDGQLTWDGGTFPLNHAVLGGALLYTDSDYIMSLKPPDQVKAIASALDALTQVEFRRRYDQIDTKSYDGELSDEDFKYTWEWFQGVRQLYRRAAAEARYVLFTADQ